MIKKKALEIKLQELEPYTSVAGLEQYGTPTDIAADMLHLAFSHGDIGDRKVVDLGCGNGIFAIGAKLLGAKEVIGVEVDPGAMRAAERNMSKMGVEVNLVESDVEDFSTPCDTVVQNPPFGAQKGHKHADMVFVKKAFEIAPVVYSLHLSKTQDFVLRNIELCGAKVVLTKSYKLHMPHTYPFHKRERKDFEVTMVRGIKDD
jgi:putative methylase